jgi:hypothetical protein
MEEILKGKSPARQQKEEFFKRKAEAVQHEKRCKEEAEIKRLNYLITKTDSSTDLTFYSLPLPDEDELRRYVELKQLKKRRTRNWIDKLIIEKLELIIGKIKT